MAEVGEMPKPSLKERVREAFTKQGAKEKWYRDHKEVVKQYTDVNNGLSDEQRAQAITQIEADATKSAKINVGGHWVALAAGTATLALGAVGIAKPELVVTAMDKLHLGDKKVGKAVITAAEKSHDFLAHLPGNAKDLANKAKVEAGKAVNSAKAAWESFRKKPPKPPGPVV